MSIAAPRYALPPPALVDRRRRVLAIVRQEFTRRVRALNLVFLAFIYIGVLLPVVFDFFFRSFAVGIPGPTVAQSFFAPYSLGVWYLFLFLLTGTVGAAIVSGDFATRAITLFLSRPISRFDYLLAKAGAVGLWLMIGAIVPGAIAAAIVLALGYVSLPVALAAAGGFVLVGLLATIAFTGIVLALSALASRPVFAGVGIFGLLLGAEVIANVFASASGRQHFLYISPEELVSSAARGALGVSGNPIDPWVSAGLLLVIGLVGGALAYLRLSREEVVAE